MATDPAFAATVNLGGALLGAVETNLQVPTTASTIVTAGASGTRIDEITVQASATSLVATTVAGLVYIFLYDGTHYRLFDTYPVNAITVSATVQPFRLSRIYQNLILKNGWSLVASQSQSSNASILQCLAFGADF